MKWIKKVAETPLTAIARVIDSLTPIPNDRVNAPSIHAVNEAITSRFSYIYPVGSIYLTVADVNPAALFGGTWERIREKFLLAGGDDHAPGTTGGDFTKTGDTGAHALTVEEMPAHTHPKPENTYGFSTYTRDELTNPFYYSMEGTAGLPDDGDYVEEIPSAGGGQAHTHTYDINVTPPYLSVYVWKRTA